MYVRHSVLFGDCSIYIYLFCIVFVCFDCVLYVFFLTSFMSDFLNDRICGRAKWYLCM